jgi:hypothetical protein
MGKVARFLEPVRTQVTRYLDCSNSRPQAGEGYTTSEVPAHVGRTPISVNLRDLSHKILETRFSSPQPIAALWGAAGFKLTPIGRTPWPARVPLDPSFANGSSLMHHTGKPARGPAADRGGPTLAKRAALRLSLPSPARHGAARRETRPAGAQAKAGPTSEEALTRQLSVAPLSKLQQWFRWRRRLRLRPTGNAHG